MPSLPCSHRGLTAERAESREQFDRRATAPRAASAGRQASGRTSEEWQGGKIRQKQKQRRRKAESDDDQRYSSRKEEKVSLRRPAQLAKELATADSSCKPQLRCVPIALERRTHVQSGARTARKGRALARAWTKPGCPSVPVGLLPQRMAPAAPVRTGTRRMPWVCPERRASHAMAHARDSKGHGSCGGVSRRPMRAGRAPRRPSAPPLRACRAVPSLPPPPPRVSPKLRRRTVERPPCFLDTVDQGLPRLPTIHVCPSGASPSRSSPRAPLARQRRRRLRGGGYTWSQ